MSYDKGKFVGLWSLAKFEDPDGAIERLLKSGLPIEDVARMHKLAFISFEAIGENLLLNEGIGNLWDLVAGLGSPTAYNNANARVGVGDNTTVAAATQTALQAVTNKAWVGMDVTYPSRSAQTVDWRGSFGSGVANFAWNEMTVVNTADDTGPNLNRLVSAQGTKIAGQTWTLSVQITLS